EKPHANTPHDRPFHVVLLPAMRSRIPFAGANGNRAWKWSMPWPLYARSGRGGERAENSPGRSALFRIVEPALNLIRQNFQFRTLIER
ncbi:MAG: hypothetical protein NXH88_13880, partial [Hyphomonas sp.]|nr:hypothetical protein [Hyphomonas sp.]